MTLCWYNHDLIMSTNCNLAVMLHFIIFQNFNIKLWCIIDHVWGYLVNSVYFQKHSIRADDTANYVKFHGWYDLNVVKSYWQDCSYWSWFCTKFMESCTKKIVQFCTVQQPHCLHCHDFHGLWQCGKLASTALVANKKKYWCYGKVGINSWLT